MRLYGHRVWATSRPVALFAVESGIELGYQLVVLITGELLDEALIARANAFLCGDASTLADYLGSRMALGARRSAAPSALTRTSRAGSPTRKGRGAGAKVNEAFYKCVVAQYVVEPSEGDESVQV